MEDAKMKAINKVGLTYKKKTLSYIKLTTILTFFLVDDDESDVSEK